MARTEREIIASIKAMENKLYAADDAELAEESEEIADEEVKIVEESTDVDVESDILNQNERAMNNWPIEARRKVAKRILNIARMMIE